MYCKSCGAPLHSERCIYCGTIDVVYRNKNLENEVHRQIYIDGKLLSDVTLTPFEILRLESCMKNPYYVPTYAKMYQYRKYKGFNV